MLSEHKVNKQITAATINGLAVANCTANYKSIINLNELIRFIELVGKTVGITLIVILVT